MNANEAKKLTEGSKTVRPEEISGYLNIIYKKIDSAAREGKSETVLGFEGIRVLGPDEKQGEAIAKHLEEVDGYTIKSHRGYTTIHW